jgi:hypothetical protein
LVLFFIFISCCFSHFAGSEIGIAVVIRHHPTIFHLPKYLDATVGLKRSARKVPGATVMSTFAMLSKGYS